MPKEFTARAVLPHGQQHRLGSLPLRITVLLAALAGLTSPAAADEVIVGRASVIDGDTIEIRGERIRFNGIDAPEAWQLCQDRSGKDYRCGQVAATALDEFLSRSRPTRCEFVERDRYDRFVGNCFRADGQSVASWLVRNGHALDWPRYSKKAYAADQGYANQNGLGIWQGEFVLPWDARAARNGS